MRRDSSVLDTLRAVAVLLVCALAMYFALSAAEPSSHSRLAAWGVCLALAVTLPVFRETMSPRLRRGVAWVAKYSYGIYLSHMISLWLVFAVLPDRSLAAQLVVLVVLLAVVPAALYHTIEAPFVRLGAASAVWLRRPGRVVHNAG